MGAGASAMPTNPKEVSDEQIEDQIWGKDVGEKMLISRGLRVEMG